MSDGGDTISVIIPAHNAARFLDAAISSAVVQTHRDLEIIVVDDGSEDGTADIVGRAAERDPRIRLIRQRNQGVAAARNAAIAEARGRYIAPLDADDVWHRRKLELQLAALRRVPGAQCAYTWQFEIDEEDRLRRASSEGPRWEGFILPVLVLENLVGCASNPLMSRSAVLEVGGYDASLRIQNAQGCEDWKLSLCLAERYPFAVVPLALTGYRQVRESMSTNVDRMLRSYEIVLSEFRARHPELPGSLFRWSRSKMAGWLAYRAWHAGNLPKTAEMSALSVLNDPYAAGSLAAHGLWMAGHRIRRLFVADLAPTRFGAFEPESRPPRPHLRGRIHRRGEIALRHLRMADAPPAAPPLERAP